MTSPLIRMTILLSLFALTACQTPQSFAPAPPSTLFESQWNSGVDTSEPEFHIQKIDANTIVMRQSLKTTFEAPFLYLIFGRDKVLLIDTGVKGVDLRGEVDRQIEAWRQANGGEALSLTVMHSHSHGDHIGGDAQFEDRPNTQIIGPAPDDIAAFFNLSEWPLGSTLYNLGGRTVEILPTPGHHPSHVMIFDPATRILFTGDTVYPGKLYFPCDRFSEFNGTINKISEFAEKNDVQWLLGAHIEMTTSPSITFKAEDRSRQGEHLLELSASTLNDIQSALSGMADRPVLSEFETFVIYPLSADANGCPALK